MQNFHVLGRSREPLLAHDEIDLDLQGLYRSTGFVAGDRLVVWYSQQYRE